MILPRAFVQQDQFASAVSEVERMLHPQVVHIRYDFDDDATGEPAVFFRVLLSDEASRRDHLWDVTNRVSSEIEDRVEPHEMWGVLPYFNYRSQSEQAELNEPAWA